MIVIPYAPFQGCLSRDHQEHPIRTSLPTKSAEQNPVPKSAPCSQGSSARCEGGEFMDTSKKKPLLQYIRNRTPAHVRQRSLRRRPRLTKRTFELMDSLRRAVHFLQYPTDLFVILTAYLLTHFVIDMRIVRMQKGLLKDESSPTMRE